MDTVGVLEAKTHLSALLERAERGESIAITRHGRPVARLVPAADAAAVADARSQRAAAAERLKVFADGRTLGEGPSVRDLRDAGRP